MMDFNKIIDSAMDYTLTQMELMQIAEPSFKPNPKLGDGKPEKAELDFRQSLLHNLQNVNVQFRKIYKANRKAEDKIKNVDTIIDHFIKITTDEVESTVRSRWKKGYNGMDLRLKAKGVHYPKPFESNERLDDILRQQVQNVEDIGLRLRGRLRQIINLSAIQSYYTKPAKPVKQAVDVVAKRKYEELEEDDEDSTNSAFNNAQNQLDALGLFGYVEPYRAAFLTAGIVAASAVSHIRIQVAWATAGDALVCDDCAAYEGQLFDVDAFPGPMHDNCRCGPSEVVIIFK